MDSVGIICEYNPFHNGHLYHLEKVKELFPNSIIVLVLTTCFTQRGDISLLTKEEKTKIAMHNGINLVVELPFNLTVQSADTFAKGAISILNKLKVKHLVFGSEHSDINFLKEIANIQLHNSLYDELVKTYMDDGVNYPTALSKAIYDLCDLKIEQPNDLLGLSYVKEIMRQNITMEAIPIKRTNDFHDLELKDKIVSAQAIRKALKDKKKIEEYVPKEVDALLKERQPYDYFKYLKYKIILEGKEISKYATVDEGIEKRIMDNINDCDNLEQLITRVKTKRYTYNKLSRMFCHILTSLTKEEASDKEIHYLRILGFDDKGQSYLKALKEEMDIPIITNIKKKDEELVGIQIRIEKIYSLITNNDMNSYKNPIIKIH